MQHNTSVLIHIRRAARISGSLLASFTLVFCILNMIDSMGRHSGSPFSTFSTLLILIFILWGFALAGLVLALWKEGLGGFISLAGFVLMGVLNSFNPAAPNKAGAFIIFLVFSIPSLLYISYWRLAKKRP